MAGYLYKDGVLQHGHPQASPPFTVQWHPAHTQHRVDSGLHAKHNVWQDVTWSPQNDLGAPNGLNLDQKQHMKNLARKAHDEGFVPDYRKVAAQHLQPGQSPAVDTPVIGPPAPRPQVPAPAQAPTPAVKPTPEPARELPEAEADEVDLQLLDERVSNIEELAVNVLEPLEGRLKAVDASLQRLADTDTRTINATTQAHDSIRALRSDMTDAMEKLDITERIAPLVQRVERLEETAKREVTIIVKRDEKEYRLDGLKHEKFQLLLSLATKLAPSRRNIWISGPAGSGKTTGAEQLAQALGLPYEYIGAIDTPYKLSGYRTAVGQYLDTAFRRQYATGGVILLDEVDGSSPSALLEINAALANGSAAFPDKMVKRHPNTIVLCAANTWGHGGNANYVGRMKQDVAFLSRFVKINWTYDEVLERAAAGSPGDWVDVVQATRKLAFTHKAQFVISPRASITGCELLRNGMEAKDVAEALFSDYMDNDMWPKVGQPVVDYIKHVEQQARMRQQPSPAPSPAPRPQDGIPADDLVKAKNPLEAVDFSRVKVFGQ